MIVSAINNSYSALQTASRWYWSAQTQQTLSNTVQTIAEVFTTLLLVLSQVYTDYVTLLDIWLTPGCDTETFVITKLIEPQQLDWRDVGGMLQADCSFVITWLGFTLGDLSHGVTELYYRVKTVLT
jgi:hypothetical protein